MAVDIATRPSFKAGSPVKLFEGRLLPATFPGVPNYDLSHDGQRVLRVQSPLGSPDERRVEPRECFRAIPYRDLKPPSREVSVSRLPTDWPTPRVGFRHRRAFVPNPA